MKYLSDALKFTVRNWRLMLPLFVLNALVIIISGSALSLGSILSLIQLDKLTDPNALLAVIISIFAAVFSSGIVAFLAQFVHQPATYGLVNKSLEIGEANLSDLGAAIKANFVKYLLYFVGTLVLGLLLSIATVLVLVIMGLLVSALKYIGIVLFVLVAIALVIIMFVIYILLSLWFSAMIVDDLGVVDGAKKSVEVVRNCFFTVLGVTLLVSIITTVVGSILAFLYLIPVVGSIIYSIVPTAQTFVIIVFSLILYRAKTGRENII